MRERGEGRSVLLLAAGFGLWSLAFVMLYSFQAVGCRLGWQGLEVMGGVTLQRGVLIGLFTVGIAAHLLLWRLLRQRETKMAREEEGFARIIAADLSVAALGASLFCFLAVFWLSPCL
ncbi:MAG: hypothetical protein WCY02_05960 [Parvibaculum sp.]